MSGRKVELSAVGIQNPGKVHWSLGVSALYEEAIRRGEGALSADGPIVCITSPHTGRSPNDKFVVKEASSEATWTGARSTVRSTPPSLTRFTRA